MKDDMWFVCPHCRAMFRGDNNICISCGAPANTWEGNAPVLRDQWGGSGYSFSPLITTANTSTASVMFATAIGTITADPILITGSVH
jgi:hypothetical protein